MIIGQQSMWHGDCLEMMRHIPDGSIDMILCDLPYGTTQNKWDAVIPFYPLWEQYWRVAKPNAAVVLTAQTPFDKVLGCSQIDALKYEWVWEKTHATGHLNATKQPMKAHENVLVFYNKQCKYNPQKTQNHKPSTKLVNYLREENPNYGSQKPVSSGGNTDRYPRSVQIFKSDKMISKLHPTQKPVALFEYLIKTYTNPGELVLDNCSGSGTTAIAAHRSGRRSICIEKDPTYYYGSVARVWKEVHGS